jgi:hypothetical protein
VNLGPLALAVALAASDGRGQQDSGSTGGASTGREPGSELTVYLLTFDPGPLIWERFGHNALWIRDSHSNTDWGYDYGRFSFGRTPADWLRFAGRFLRGDLNYSMGDAPARQYLDGYAAAGRSIWSQELDLPPEARLALRDFLDWNRREENRRYQYHYYLDNCSTRIRDALDRVIGGQIKTWADARLTRSTYRDHTRRTTERDPLMYTLLTTALGHPADQRITAWEEMFLPISLRPYLDSVVVRDPGGRVHPLVKESRHLVVNDQYLAADRPPSWVGRYLLIGVGLGALFLGLGRMGAGSIRWRYLLGWAGGLWSLVVGVGGAMLVFLWAFTAHRFAGWNENVFQLNLSSLVVAVAMPRGVFRHRAPALDGGLALAAGLAGLGLVAKLVPGFDQANLEVIALLLPGHLGLWAGRRLLRARLGEPR